MRNLILSLLIIACIGILVNAEDYAPRQGDIPQNKIQQFDVTTNTSYYNKWKPVFNLYGKQFRQGIRQFKQMLVEQGIIDNFWNYFITNYSKYYYLYDKEFFEEMKAISVLGLVSYQDVFTFNFMYELVAHENSNIKMCTAILLRQQDGEIVHTKNLDFMHPDVFGPMAIQFNYWDEKKENKLYSFMTTTGMVTGNSGIRYGGYSFSLNQRNKGYSQQNLIDLIFGAWNVQASLTQALKTSEKYEEYIYSIISQNYISPFYLTVASANPADGALVIQMSRKQVLQMEYLTESNWYIVQTNYDLDEEDEDYRKTYGEHYLEAIGPSANRRDVKNLLNNYPLLNNSTISMTEMDPRKGQFDVTIFW